MPDIRPPEAGPGVIVRSELLRELLALAELAQVRCELDRAAELNEGWLVLAAASREHAAYGLAFLADLGTAMRHWPQMAALVSRAENVRQMLLRRGLAPFTGGRGA